MEASSRYYIRRNGNGFVRDSSISVSICKEIQFRRKEEMYNLFVLHGAGADAATTTRRRPSEDEQAIAIEDDVDEETGLGQPSLAGLAVGTKSAATRLDHVFEQAGLLMRGSECKKRQRSSSVPPPARSYAMRKAGSEKEDALVARFHELRIKSRHLRQARELELEEDRLNTELEGLRKNADRRLQKMEAEKRQLNRCGILGMLRSTNVMTTVDAAESLRKKKELLAWRDGHEDMQNWFKSRLEREQKAQDRWEQRFYGKEEEDGIDLQPPLEEEEVEMFENAMHGPPNEIVVSAFNVDLPRQKFVCLAEGGWLNDEIVNMYMKVLRERSLKLAEAREGWIPSYFHSSFFYTKLFENNR